MKKKSVKDPSWDQLGKVIGSKIEKEFKRDDSKKWVFSGNSCGGCGGAVYGLGFVAALFYYVTTATSFWMGVVGVLKAIVWPAFLVYGLMQFLAL